jgi:hypothetical protein
MDLVHTYLQGNHIILHRRLLHCSSSEFRVSFVRCLSSIGDQRITLATLSDSRSVWDISPSQGADFFGGWCHHTKSHRILAEDHHTNQHKPPHSPSPFPLPLQPPTSTLSNSEPRLSTFFSRLSVHNIPFRVSILRGFCTQSWLQYQTWLIQRRLTHFPTTPGHTTCISSITLTYDLPRHHPRTTIPMKPFLGPQEEECL